MGKVSFTNALGWAIRMIAKYWRLFEEGDKFKAEERLEKLQERYDKTRSKADDADDKAER